MSSASSLVVLDNGAYTAKIGFSSDEEPKLIQNCIAKAKSERRKQFIGNQYEDCRDLSGLYYLLPFQKGYLVNWDVQRQVWEHIFGKEVMNLEPPETSIIITEPYFNFGSIQDAMNEVFFEEYQFQAIHRTNAGTLSAFRCKKEPPKELCCMVVDSGYSFTHIAPYYDGKKVGNAIRRINVGGKLLTNHLKEILSYRQLHVMDETYVINQVKEDVCYVSSQFMPDMEITKLKGAENTIVRDYVLPDFQQIRRGYVKDESSASSANEQCVSLQIIRMNNERFSVPELLFNPSDVSIQEMGIPEAIVHCIGLVEEEMRPHLYKNILLTGGNSLFPGFKERVERDVRAMAPLNYDVRVTLPEKPITYSWQGGKLFSAAENFKELCVTKKEYEEYGQSICLEKFDV
ncbi:Actin-related protein 6 [Holothuria leucospilota]|uniref:Actin-related protein 6 n=1 Tax=Holothuria leucospilota TaxID=206669 RepID=A0A9Q1BT79_HOLLE|nr:Actin-related protein 6 [Holothuria leucospilota]